MKARITVHICDLCHSYTQDVVAEGGVVIPQLAIHHGSGGDYLKDVFICDNLKDVFICDTCMRDEPLSLLKLYERINELRSENQS